MRAHVPLFLAAVVFGSASVALLSCGAENKDSPSKGMAPLNPATCQTFSALAPALHEALIDDDLAGLRGVLLQLSQTPEDGSEPPLNQVLQAVFVAVHEFAGDPAEGGAPADDLCNDDNPPPLAETNRLCDLRRALKIYVHEGRAGQSLHAFDPIVAAVLDYITGKAPVADHPHYEIARDLELMCTQTGQCDPHDTFQLVEGITNYLSPSRAQDTLVHIENLVNDPRLEGVFNAIGSQLPDGGTDASGEGGFELLANELICALAEIDTSTPDGRAHYFDTFDALLNGSGSTPGLYSLIDSNYPPADVGLPDGGIYHSDLHAEVAVAADDLRHMLDPDLAEPILQPLQRAGACLTVSAPSGTSFCGRTLRPGFVPMIYHLGFQTHAVGLSQILASADQLVAIDAQSEEPGMVMLLLHDTASALERDDEALDALTTLCHSALSTERPCDDGDGDDCPALPLDYYSTGVSPHVDGCTNGAGKKYDVSLACQSNVEAVVPEVATLFDQGVTDEILCTLDTLVYGCTGGPQPACTSQASP